MSHGVEQKTIQTDRLAISYLQAGDVNHPVVLLIHGNVSSNVFWDETITRLSSSYRVIAPDLRGYGESEFKEIDASRGVRDWSDDLHSLVEALEIEGPVHLVGWSLGGGVVMQYAIDFPDSVASLTLLNPISPFGFGGTKDEQGTPCHENWAGSGGGTANPEFVSMLLCKDRSGDSPNTPRSVMNQFYFTPPFRVSEAQEERYVEGMLSTRIADGAYPGTYQTCVEWPGVAPGAVGINNAMSPKYFDVSAIADSPVKSPILWVRGANDSIVSDHSLLDFGFLGQQGFVPGWPGDEVYPPQPMIKQTRFVLEKYQANGGRYEECIVEGAGHSPHIEKPAWVHERIMQFLQSIK